MSKANVKFEDYCQAKKWPQAAKYQFRYVYVFDDFVGKNFFCITRDDSVYVFGSNSSGCLGLDHNQPIPEPTLIPDLCSKSITSVYRGQSHMLARNDKNEVFCWGHNTCGQLGIGIHKKFVIYRAQHNPVLSQKNIVEISCGSNHSLGLSANGELYAWGDNDHGQVGCGSPNKFHSKPVKLTFFRNFVVKAICCGSNHSVAMTSLGQLYAWGDNGYGQLGIGTDDDLINGPRQVDLAQLNGLRVDKIVCSKFSTYFLMSDKTIYFYGTTDQEDSADLNKLSNNTKIVDMHAVHHCLKGYIFTAVTDSVVYEIIESWKEFEKHYNHNNLVEFYAKKYRITYKMIDFDFRPKMVFKSNQSLGTILKTRSFDNILLTNRQLSKPSFETFESRFKNIHEIKEEIGTGTFGRVYKVKHTLDNQVYAVKKIMTYDVTDEWKLLEELKIYTKIDHSHVVNYYSVWMEHEECLYIQMEYCETNLRQVITVIHDIFDRHDANPAMKTIEYFICCEILKEILKGLKCLHNCDPAIIHGNFNLHNVLITYANIGKSFVKLGGYGLAKYKYIYEIECEHPTYGRHIAPEVMVDECYYDKSDIYSLGVICQHVFDDIIKKDDTDVSPFEDKMDVMRGLMNRMLLYPNWTDRPSSKDILAKADEWSLRWEQITKNHPISDLRSLFVNFLDNQFLYKFLSVKSGKGFDKIVLNKPDKTIGKNTVPSVYRSNSVSRHWKKTDCKDQCECPCSMDPTDDHAQNAPANADSSQ